MVPLGSWPRSYGKFRESAAFSTTPRVSNTVQVLNVPANQVHLFFFLGGVMVVSAMPGSDRMMIACTTGALDGPGAGVIGGPSPLRFSTSAMLAPGLALSSGFRSAPGLALSS